MIDTQTDRQTHTHTDAGNDNTRRPNLASGKNDSTHTVLFFLYINNKTWIPLCWATLVCKDKITNLGVRIKFIYTLAVFYGMWYVCPVVTTITTTLRPIPNHVTTNHYKNVIMSAMSSQITGTYNACSSVCSGADQRTHQSSASLAFVRGIRRWPLDSPHKGPLRGKLFHLMTSSSHLMIRQTLADHIGVCPVLNPTSCRGRVISAMATRVPSQIIKR